MVEVVETVDKEEVRVQGVTAKVVAVDLADKVVVVVVMVDIT